ncbi:MAG TPA: hypothetical protein VFI40_02725 [Nocardioides sp.]|nr:hypothetical protein [Nocardioides sp.]
MDRDWAQALGRIVDEQRNRPFGDTESVSGRTLQPFSFAGLEAATNLLTKAIRALDRDESERARGYVDRAVRLPYDRHEETEPVAMAVHMMLFCDVTDALEDSDEDDLRWLDAAIDVLSTADEGGRCTMRDVLAAIDQDYALHRRESAALRSAIADVPARPELRDLRLDPQAMADCVMSVLAGCRNYRVALRQSR